MFNDAVRTGPLRTPLANAAFIAAIVLLIAAAVFVRSWQMTDSLWVDELHTSWVVTDGFSELANRAALGNQPPLYFAIVRLSVLLFGESELALRAPSLGASVAAVCMLGLVAWRISRSKLAVVVTLFIAAIDHEMIFYASEARVYAILHLVSAVHIAVLLELTFLREERLAERLVKSRETEFAYKLIAWGGTGVLLISLHFLTGLFLAVEFGLIVVWVLWRRDLPRKEKWLLPLISVLAMLSIAFYWPLLVDIFARRENWRAFISTEVSLLEFAWHVWPIPFYVVVPFAGFCYWWLRQHQNKRKLSPNFKVVVLLSTIALAPVLFAWVVTVNDWLAIFHARFFAPSLAALLLLPATAYRHVTGRVIKWCMAIIVCVGGLWFNAPFDTFYEHGRFVANRNEDWRAAVAYVNNQQDQFPIVIYSGLIEANELHKSNADRWREYASLPIRGIYRVAGDVKVVPLAASGDLLSAADRSELKKRPGVTLIIRGDGGFADEVAMAFAEGFENFERVESRRFGGVSVYLLRKGE